MIRLLIVEDQNTILQLLKSYLERESNLKIVAIAADGKVAVDKVGKYRPDVVLMDVEMPGIDGITATRIISQRYPKTKVLILTSHNSDRVFNLALQAGAKGYILKTTPARELIEFIQSVHQGKLQLKSGLVQRFQPDSQPIPSQEKFSALSSPKLPAPPTPKPPYFFIGVLLNLAVWSSIIIYWKVTPPQYTSEWGIKLLETQTGVDLNLPNIGTAEADNNSGNRQDSRTDYVYIASDPAVLEKAAEVINMSVGEFGKPEITVDDDSNIISLAIEGDLPLEAQHKAYVFHQVLTQKIDSLREAEIEREDRQTQTTIDEARQKLDVAQERLSTYQASSSVNSEEQVRQLANNLEELRLQQAELSAEEQGSNNLSQQLEKELELSSQDATAAYQLLEDNVYQEQSQKYAQVRTELTDLLSRFTSENPLVVNKQAELDEATVALQQRAAFLLGREVSRNELERIAYLTLDPKVKTVRQEVFKDLITNQANRQKLEAQIRELKAQTERLESRQQDVAQEKLRLDSLQRDLKVAEAIFATALAQLDLNKESVYSIYPPIQLIKEPTLPKEDKPTSPNLRLLLLAGMAGSFLVTTGLILLWFERQPSQLQASNSPRLSSLSSVRDRTDSANSRRNN